MIDIVIIAIFSFWFAELTKIPQRLSQRIKTAFGKDWSLKPFSCTKCLSFWIGFVHGWLIGLGVASIIYGGLCSFSGILAFKLWERIK